jgi:hypothetical protein
MMRKIGAILQSFKASKEEVEEAYKSVYSNAEKCIHCGVIIPEGRLICPQCESEVEKR